MATKSADRPRLLRTTAGRARYALPDVAATTTIASRLRRAPGITEARASERTGNVLVLFDPEATDDSQILARLESLLADVLDPAAEDPASAQRPGDPQPATAASRRRRARIAVAGLERDPELGARIVEHLEGRPGIERVVPSTLTGRVLVEFAAGLADDIDDIALELTELEPEEAAGERPARHPLEKGAAIQGAARLLGAGTGLALLFSRQALGRRGPPTGSRVPAVIAGGASIAEAMPPIRDRLERALGHDGRDLLLGVASMASLTLSGSALGLCMAGAAALRVLTEARSRRSAWVDYEDRLAYSDARIAGRTMSFSGGARLALPGEVVEGFGTAIDEDGGLIPASPGAHLPAGARINGGPLDIRLAPAAPATPRAAEALDRTAQGPYLRYLPAVAIVFAAGVGVLTRSPMRAFGALLLVNPRPAVLGAEAADHGASARAVRSGVTVVGARPRRPIQSVDALLLHSARLLTDGHEYRQVFVLDDSVDRTAAVNVAAGISAAVGSPWGSAFPLAARIDAQDATFDGESASAEIDGERWTLAMASPARIPDGAKRQLRDGEQVLLLRRAGQRGALAAITLRPRIPRGTAALVDACRAADVSLELAARRPGRAAEAIAQRAGVTVVTGMTIAERAARLRADGARVAVVSDSADAGQAFEESDIAIGIASGRRGPFAARADVLAATPEAVGAIVEAGQRHDAAVRDAVGLSVVANVAGAVWELGAAPDVGLAGSVNHVAGLVAITSSWLRLRGGSRARSVAERLSDPQPERWGGEPLERVLQEMESRRTGLTSAEVADRWRPPPEDANGNGLPSAAWAQVETPLTAALAGAAMLSYGFGALGDVAVLAAAVGVNAAVGAWQERQAGRATHELRRRGARSATVLRDGRGTLVDTTELVPGDVLVLASGDRIPADCRLIHSRGLIVDEAALTGESFPVVKSTRDGGDAERVVLEGTDVLAGTGRAVVVAVGDETRMGAVTAALAIGSDESPLIARLDEIFRQSLPAIVVGGTLVTLAGVIWRRSVTQQLALGAAVAAGALPDGLPLLAGIAEAGVGLRLARRKALIRRISSVEALGRVDVVCADKTGTMTTGRLALTALVDPEGNPEALDRPGSQVLLTAALASPHPDAPDAHAHPTDVVVLEAARHAGIEDAVHAPREREMSFDPARGYHAALVDGRLCVKGAAEVLVPRCAAARWGGEQRPLDRAGRERLIERADSMAADGLRVLMVAEGGNGSRVDDPSSLVALGFIGIADPLRDGVSAAVGRCHRAGVRVVMLTGDHPETARAAAHEAGLPISDEALLTGFEVNELDDEQLAQRLERACVIARISPLDKLRVVELLQRSGHVVAMTGDGVNDAPALRLAHVGVAMGLRGTEVASQAADIVLADDDFVTLVEALVEGRAFWRNLRRAIALLLGGNLGEIALISGASIAGLGNPITTRQVLALNLVTDVFPAVAIAAQPPRSRHLSELARQGDVALDGHMRGEIARRAAATAVPSLLAYAAAARQMSPTAASGVAFTSVVGSQLAQALLMGRSEGQIAPAVAGAIGASAAMLAASIAVPQLRGFLGFAAPGPIGLAYAALAVGGGVLLSLVLPEPDPDLAEAPAAPPVLIDARRGEG